MNLILTVVSKDFLCPSLSWTFRTKESSRRRAQHMSRVHRSGFAKLTSESEEKRQLSCKERCDRDGINLISSVLTLSLRAAVELLVVSNCQRLLHALTPVSSASFQHQNSSTEGKVPSSPS
jgi:hypothetical protein